MTILSMQRPTDSHFHSAFDLVNAEVNYLTADAVVRLAIIKAHINIFCRQPWRYLTTLAFTLTSIERGGFAGFSRAVNLTALAQAKGIGHIHAHFASEPAGLAELVQRLSNITYSISAHAKDIYLQNKTSLCRKIDRAQFVVTCTEYNRRYLQSINDSETPIYRLYHGIDSDRVLSENSLAYKPSSTLRILSVGRLREKKGFPTLIAACRLLAAGDYQFQCDIVGYGPDQEALQGLIEHYQLQNNVHLTGKLTHKELVVLYRQTSIFALPCQIGKDGDRDGIPNVLMEAMTFAIPVVSTRVSGITELIEHNLSGLLVEAKNHQELFGAFKRLIDNPQLRKQLGDAGKERISTQFCARQHIEYLKQLLVDELLKHKRLSFNVPVTGEQHG
jgi:glycosyltransferase involved in cell wall biosynthesis